MEIGIGKAETIRLLERHLLRNARCRNMYILSYIGMTYVPSERASMYDDNIFLQRMSYSGPRFNARMTPAKVHINDVRT